VCTPRCSSTRRPTPRAAWPWTPWSMACTAPAPTPPCKAGRQRALILCFLRHLSEREAFETLEQALPLRDKFIGVGLDSSELGHPPEKFARVFARCRELGLHLVAHAGEEGPARLHLDGAGCAEGRAHRPRRAGGARRCADAATGPRPRAAHGVPAVQPQALRVFPSLAAHNLGGCWTPAWCATVNSDDPAYFGGYINDNFTQAVFAATGLAYHSAGTPRLHSWRATASKQLSTRRQAGAGWTG
jgi:hypothetical protein